MTHTTRRLHLNESGFPPSQKVVDAVTQAAMRMNRYPNADAAELQAELAQYTGAPVDRVVLSSGSNELLHLLPLVAEAHGQGDQIVLANPSFPTYDKVARFHKLNITAVPVDANGLVDVSAMLAAITPQCKLICVPSPNNPTGGMLPVTAIEALIAGVPETTLLHFDEAYYEFGRQAGGPDTLPLLEKHKGPWLASRSFSKAFGLAGARLGYAIASSAELAQRCRSLMPNFSVNGLALAAGRAALSDSAHNDAMISKTSAERERLAEKLTALGFAPLPSAANFVAFPLSPTHSDLIEKLAQNHILVSKFALADGTPFMRVSVGTSEDTDMLCTVLAQLLVAQ